MAPMKALLFRNGKPVKASALVMVAGGSYGENYMINAMTGWK